LILGCSRRIQPQLDWSGELKGELPGTDFHLQAISPTTEQFKGVRFLQLKLQNPHRR
tara:strand:- start:18 stop:188 length:171 start_codon:yes stop_codon:yes gene_type:complete